MLILPNHRQIIFFMSHHDKIYQMIESSSNRICCRTFSCLKKKIGYTFNNCIFRMNGCHSKKCGTDHSAYLSNFQEDQSKRFDNVFDSKIIHAQGHWNRSPTNRSNHSIPLKEFSDYAEFTHNKPVFDYVLNYWNCVILNFDILLFMDIKFQKWSKILKIS